MTHDTRIAAGVIEGFFGRCWTWQNRRELASFLKSRRLSFYLYAPKADKHLRSQWRAPHSSRDWQQLHLTREAYRAAGVDFGVGLSPLDLCSHAGVADTAALDKKLEQLNTLNLDYLALLFDDMRGDMPQLAERQSALANRAADTSNARRIILCPTYYSTDPILEKVFGTAPPNYLEDIGAGLDAAIDIFWTGPKVCSDSYPQQHLREITERLGRKPFLWDNYPVNDGAVRSKHLYLEAPGADRADAAPLVSGIAANPMNQFFASLPALASLGRAVSDEHYEQDTATRETLFSLYPDELANHLIDDIPNLQTLGLDGLSEQQKQLLIERYSSQQHSSPITKEICEWLQGGYKFDPNCLTE
ncbi:beta-N-acetylglucosaminidase domain-containing protein [Gilvimarinus sp. SDUM040013]|uniref:Beta-N-acetylglucosaminidase domain-containing protein n=1 Tax=Gilvimarinus gilvus TaxID=3058038 RepID=A0ABU4RXN3_9GAMM|nr:beta-N-acetylglucosaminidase domain-containing protein [Gilvimarinus sp. SDUM040013]MDO3386689.1 beta-N-acetylglucosaminidase domain-containing protein [Gilvimarinus sp. SDUM040013]MDX6849424.1 beta-N-acetylglucosaminidase domain-containing protein [Gilvimarinus sp. SDUM040013]